MLPNLGMVAETLRKSSEIREQTALMCESSALQWPFGNSMYPCLFRSDPFEFKHIRSTPSAIAFAAHSNICMGFSSTKERTEGKSTFQATTQTRASTELLAIDVCEAEDTSLLRNDSCRLFLIKWLPLKVEISGEVQNVMYKVSLEYSGSLGLMKTKLQSHEGRNSRFLPSSSKIACCHFESRIFWGIKKNPGVV
jgi:hypothetical protein